jgi:hypothetical protein
MYDSGTGVPRHAALAAGWYRRAAEAGDLGAQVAPGESSRRRVVRACRRTSRRRGCGTALPRRARQQTPAMSRCCARRASAWRRFCPRARWRKSASPSGRYLFRGLAAGRCLIALQGRIGPGATAAFDAVVERARAKGCGVPWIILESGGGRLDDGLAPLGKEVHLLGLLDDGRAQLWPRPAG